MGYADAVENAFQNMHSRCKSNAAYIKKGITVCERWNDKDTFVSDMGDRPTTGHSLDRIDNSKGYSPDNCRWATQKQQTNNLDKNVMLTHNGKTQTMSEWADELGIHYCTINSRKHKGLPTAEILSTYVGQSTVKRRIEHNGMSKTYKQWEEITGIPAKLIKGRINDGWSAKRALETPKMTQFSH